MEMLLLQELHKAVTADSERRKSFSSVEKYETLLNDPETNSELKRGGSADVAAFNITAAHLG